MKKFLSVTLLIFMLLPLLAMASNGTDTELFKEQDYEELWERKYEAEGEIAQTGVAEWVIYLCPFVGNDLTVLLYTDAFDDLHFERRVFCNAEAENGAAWYVPGDRETMYLPSYYQSYSKGTAYMYSDELTAVLDSRCMRIEDDGERTQILPYLRGCIEEYGITKEELIAAYELSRTDPDAIREKLSIFTDEEFEIMKKRGLLTCVPEREYLIDALYLPDEAQVRDLCLQPFATSVEEEIIFCSHLMHDKSGELTRWLLEKNPSSIGYHRFLQNALQVADRYDWLDNGHRHRLAALCGNVVMPTSSEEEVEEDPLDREFPLGGEDFLNDERPAPQTGEHTAVYLCLSVGALSVLCACGLLLRKRKAIL